MRTLKLFFIFILIIPLSFAQSKNDIYEEADCLPKMSAGDVIEWHRDFHKHPELSTQEFRTSAKAAEHLRGPGLNVKTNEAITGMAGLLETIRPGPVVALRADMDAEHFATLVFTS